MGIAQAETHLLSRCKSDHFLAWRGQLRPEITQIDVTQRIDHPDAICRRYLEQAQLRLVRRFSYELRIKANDGRWMQCLDCGGPIQAPCPRKCCLPCRFAPLTWGMVLCIINVICQSGKACSVGMLLLSDYVSK